MNEPQNTCPDIDDVVDALKNLSGEIQKEIEDRIYQYYHGSRSTLEKLRKANSDLREWGTYWKDEAESLKGEVKQLNQDISDLKYKVGELLERLG